MITVTEIILCLPKILCLAETNFWLRSWCFLPFPALNSHLCCADACADVKKLVTGARRSVAKVVQGSTSLQPETGRWPATRCLLTSQRRLTADWRQGAAAASYHYLYHPGQPSPVQRDHRLQRQRQSSLTDRQPPTTTSRRRYIISQTVFIVKNVNVKPFPSLTAHRAALISVS